MFKYFCNLVLFHLFIRFGYVVFHNVHIKGESTIKYTFCDQEKCKVAIN
jgi:hypothetical protein